MPKKLYEHGDKTPSLNKLQGETMSFEDIQDMIGPENSKHTRFMTYSQLTQFKSLKELWSNNYYAAIVFLQQADVRKDAVGHFICLLKFPTYTEHFDSYGFSADDEIEITKPKVLSQWFNNSQDGLVQNHRALQKMGSHINTCGRWMAVRILLRHLELESFIKFMDSVNAISDDMLVTIMTMLLCYKK